MSFSEFWAIWPKRKARQEAVKAWHKLNPDRALFNLIVANLECHASAGDWADPRFIPNPATYLNGKRWDDDVYPDSGPSPPNGCGFIGKHTDRSWREGLL